MIVLGTSNSTQRKRMDGCPGQTAVGFDDDQKSCLNISRSNLVWHQ